MKPLRACSRLAKLADSRDWTIAMTNTRIDENGAVPLTSPRGYSKDSLALLRHRNGCGRNNSREALSLQKKLQLSMTRITHDNYTS